MVLSKYFKRFDIKHNLILILFYFLSCSSEKVPQEVSWSESLDYFLKTGNEIEAFYFVDIGAQQTYVGGLVEIYQLPEMENIDRLRIESIEFFSRNDGLPMCRIWGTSAKHNSLNHLLARNCVDITDY